MANFEQAIKVVLKNEGGLEENLYDRGGVTNFGISFRFLQSITKNDSVVGDDIRKMTESQAIEIYRENFWNNTKFPMLEDQEIATIALDCAVDCGISESVKTLQRACNEVLKCGLEIDGVLGFKTLHAANTINPKALIDAYRDERVKFYEELVKNNPKDQTFLDGWIARARRT